MDAFHIPTVKPDGHLYHLCEKDGRYYLCSYSLEDGETIVKRVEMTVLPPSIYDALILQLEQEPSITSIMRNGTL
jgi:hypothetical protein